MYLPADKDLIIGAEIVPLLIAVGPRLIAPIVLLSEILLTFLPEILISGSSKVIEILVGDLVSIALLLGLDETKVVCALAIGVASRSRPVASAIKRFIIAKGICLRDIKRPSGGMPPEGLSEWTRYLRYPGHRLIHGGPTAFL